MKFPGPTYQEKLRLQQIAKYGPGSEKLSSLQLELLELKPGVSNTEVAAESEREALPSSSEDKKRRQHPGRQTLPADSPPAGSSRVGQEFGLRFYTLARRKFLAMDE